MFDLRKNPSPPPFKGFNQFHLPTHAITPFSCNYLAQESFKNVSTIQPWFADQVFLLWEGCGRIPFSILK